MVVGTSLVLCRVHRLTKSSIMTKFFYVFAFMFFMGLIFQKLLAQDMPMPVANYKTLSAGSLVVGMDNSTQANSTNMFNLKAYGLIVYLLNNNTKVKWVIRAGKNKDDIDFSTSAVQIKPVAGITFLYDFRSGPFVIYSADTSGVASLIDNFNSAISNVGDKVKVFRTAADVVVDERYDLTGFKPKAALLNNGGNWDIHRDYLLNAGINFGMNATGNIATNWSQAIASDLLVNCYTFASEAHWSETNTAYAKPVTDNIKAFLTAGGNVLAECAAVRTYENAGRFHSTGGINPVTENTFNDPLTVLVYNNADLSFSQFQGAVNIRKGGSLQNWTYSGNIQNKEHDHVKGMIANANIGASLAKLSTTENGGLLYYLGNHKFDRVDDLTVLNGIRMYLNAFLTPTANKSLVCLSSTQTYPINYNGSVCFANPSKTNISTSVIWNYDPNKQAYVIRVTVSKDFVDNTYGTGSIGWNKGHKFSNMVSSDYLQLALLNNNGTKAIEFKMDYISTSSGVASGYKSLGVSGGNGKMLLGNAADVVGVKTSLDANFNDYGYKLTSNSPITNSYYSSNSVYPNWVYDVWYEVEVKASAFGSSGFGTASIANLYANPGKTGNTTEMVDLTPCFKVILGDKIAQHTQIISTRDVNVKSYPNPAINSYNISINSDKKGTAAIYVVNAAGINVLTKNLDVLPGSNVLKCSSANLVTGLYEIRVVVNGQTFNQKLFVVK